ncbi:non-ribosomal peptide synthetase [Trichocoleus sp. FACHB-262]|uniref:non-ribosomal peptide synthetase n=1 Tax=Trichocoleus sp. FACHB-262 TaxID=2692869 RepID=UPI0016832B0A|nr:non-ribosomal peptide synthetase [Trichocoleus sp. FACHB-262]MBD2120848.1 amino acid adenylation domain-containing protein [Trichocoleus sp. FACHB-262]
MVIENPVGNVSEEVFVFPTSFAQQRLWFLEQLVPNTCLYNVPTVFRLTGALNVVVLEQCFNELVRRHETLRTTFVMIDGEPAQAIAPRLQIPLSIIDLQHCSVLEREAEAQRLIRTEMQRPFCLSQGPLIRLMLFRLAPSEHILLINLHHIVFDEWSSGILIRELGTLYTALSAGQESPLAELPIQYADFAHWQREWLQGDILASQLAYWRQQLREVPVLDLPTDRPRPKLPTYQGALHQVELPQSLAEALNALSQNAGTTLFMTLLAAFQTLLYRYTGQTDIAIGSPIANRNRSELESLIGFFANSLVLRGDLSGNPNFVEILERSRQMTLAAYAHQDVPFEKLVEELHPVRNPSHNPLFQVVFALQNAPMTQLELPGLTLDAIEFDTRSSRFDLELYLWECGENFRGLWGQGWQNSTGLRGVVVYNTDLFQPETIARFMRSLQTLLEAVVANPHQRLADLPVLTAAEQKQILLDWNQTNTAYPKSQCIHQLFEAQVEKSPDAIALQFGDKQFTYQALNQGSNQLAHYLQKLGVEAKTFVGVCLERSSEMVAALLGILKSGGAYVPLDPTYPSERLRFMIEDAQVPVLLTQSEYREQFRDCSVQVICLDQEWAAIAQEMEENLSPQVTPEDLAYVVYTSGSTGQPKGVAVPHRAVNRLVCDTNYIQIHPSDRIAQVSNVSFDAATFEIWGALLNGAQLIGIDREVSLSPLKFATALAQQQIDILFLTTALFNQVASEVPTAFHRLRYLLFGGEVADLQQVRAVIQAGAPKHLLHVYGPTECTTFASWYEIQELSETATLPIGRPVANTQLYILDTQLQPVPIGAKGELYIGGDGLATGYLNQSKLTAERFISYKNEASYLYKTGDLARYQSDGNIEFLGRTDNQVKLRGFRIELGEVEAALQQHPQVQAAIAKLQSSEPQADDLQADRDQKSLVAYIVSSQKPAPTTSELRSFLKAKLPEYMIPSAIAVLEILPLTPNGKVDRRALPLVSLASVAGMTAAQAPQTEIEQKLAAIWMRLLGLPQVGVHDNFFELGGHSLLATQLMSRIRDVLQVEVPLRSLFEAPTIAGLAKQMETLSWIGRRQEVSGAIAVGREEVEF